MIKNLNSFTLQPQNFKWEATGLSISNVQKCTRFCRLVLSLVRIRKLVKIPNPAASRGFYRKTYFFREIIAERSFCEKCNNISWIGFMSSKIKITVKYWWDEGIYYSLLD